MPNYQNSTGIASSPVHAGPFADPGPATRIDAALAALRSGEPVVVADDQDREGEGDLIAAAELVTPEVVGFLIRHTSGILCVGLPGDRLDQLRLPPMVAGGDEAHGTAFTVSVDARTGVTTGISAADRARTIAALAEPTTRPEDFTRPGHVYPLKARPLGVLERRGHTEAAVDLTRLARLRPAGVLSEICNDDGTVATPCQVRRFARAHGLAYLTVSDLVAYRRRTERLVEHLASAPVTTEVGAFVAHVLRALPDGTEHVAFTAGDLSTGAPLVRLHSECLTGDVFASARCDCGRQLQLSLAMIAREGRGAVVYLRGHEGRGIGLADKLRAYVLQDAGRDTVQANVDLGHPPDARDFWAGAHILRALGVGATRLLTNNPAKVEALRQHGIAVVERVPLFPPATPQSIAYLRDKRDKLGHLLDARVLA